MKVFRYRWRCECVVEGVDESAWLRALMRVHMVLLGVLLPATKSGLGSFPSS